MKSESTAAFTSSTVMRLHPVLTYFVAAFAISWIGALMVAAGSLIRHGSLDKTSGVLMFPAMLLGPSIAALALTWIRDGSFGMRSLLARMTRVRVPARWYAMVLVPPMLVLLVLECMSRLLSPVFAPNNFFVGASFGIAAGFVEEIGWTGYLLPKVCETRGPVKAALLIGVFWSVWHLPVIDFLGAAAPHAKSLPAFFLAFSVVLIAVRVLIVWVYSHTKSLLLAQLLHASSTGSLVVFSPRVSPTQEALWYAVYAAALWVIVAVVIANFWTDLAAEVRC